MLVFIGLSDKSHQTLGCQLTIKLILNLDKTKIIIVFRRPRVQHFHLPPRVEDIEQLDCNKLLGVIF